MCPKVESSGKSNANAPVRERKAELQARLDKYFIGAKPLVGSYAAAETAVERSERAARIDARLREYFASNGVIDELGNREKVFGRFARAEESLPEGIDEESLQKRRLKFHGTEKNRSPPVYSFTWQNKGHETTFTVSVTEENILGILDRKIEKNLRIIEEEKKKTA
jgi:hypothetical protein